MKFLLFLTAGTQASPYLMGEGYDGPEIPRMKNLSEITADLNEKLKLDEVTSQFNTWAKQVEADFRAFEQKLTIQEINRELARTQKAITEHFAKISDQLQTWDTENREVIEKELTKIADDIEHQMAKFKNDFVSFHEKNQDQLKDFQNKAEETLGSWGEQIVDAFSTLGTALYNTFDMMVIEANQTIVIPPVVEP